MKDKGFTLIETIFVAAIIGILAAIAAPSWLAFVNQQRVRAANEELFRALRDAQSQAKNTKQSYSVSFKTENTTQGKVPRFAIHLANTTPSIWEDLGKDLEIKPEQVLLGTNLTGENVGGATLTYASTTAQRITFDYRGTLQPTLNGTLIVTLATPQLSNSTQAINATRRCVKVATLLGAILTGKENECNP